MKTRIRELLKAVPFRPFIIHASNDCTYHIKDSSFVLASPNPRSAILLEEPVKNRQHRLPVSLLTRVEEIADADPRPAFP